MAFAEGLRLCHYVIYQITFHMIHENAPETKPSSTTSFVASVDCLPLLTDLMHSYANRLIPN